MRRLAALVVSLFLASPAGAADALVADLSKHLVAITTGFAGADVLLFGAVEDHPDGDVVVVIRGPNRNEVVRRKDSVLGVWINRQWAQFANVPSFYQVAATRPLTDIAPEPVFARHQIGLDNLPLTIAGKQGETLDADFRQALIRHKQQNGLFGQSVQNIGFLSHRLFRTDMHFPANVPVGTYLVEVYLLSQGQVVSAQTTPLIVSKTGLGADLYEFAHKRSWAYGLLAVGLACLTGWAAARLLRR